MPPPRAVLGEPEKKLPQKLYADHYLSTYNHYFWGFAAGLRLLPSSGKRLW